MEKESSTKCHAKIELYQAENYWIKEAHKERLSETIQLLQGGIIRLSIIEVGTIGIPAQYFQFPASNTNPFTEPYFGRLLTGLVVRSIEHGTISTSNQYL